MYIQIKNEIINWVKGDAKKNRNITNIGIKTASVGRISSTECNKGS